MNPITIFTFWTYRKLVIWIFIALIILIITPILTAIILTNTGIQLVSNSIATSTSLVTEIHNPATGKIVASITQPRIWPQSGVITLDFGQPDPPFQPLHTGIDIAGKIGDPVAAFMDGTVTYAGEINWGFGKHVEINNDNSVTSIYAHLSQIDVNQGTKVKMGQIIGKVGQTGWATGPHLHFQINVYGIPVNPRTFILGNP